MAKLKAPLFSLGASGQIGKALVYFNWKGLNVVREHIVPSNPKTTGQTTQRGYMTEAVAAIHSAQANANYPLAAADVSAYALWASTVKAATTWFNQAVKNWVDQHVAGKENGICSHGLITPGANKCNFRLRIEVLSGGALNAGKIWYGTSKTALINSQVATPAAMGASVDVAGLTTGVKYYFQYRITGPVGYVGSRSGIYYGVAA